MMRIESVATQPDRAGRYLIKFEDGSTMRLYRQTVEDFALYPGKTMEEFEMRQLRTAAGQMSAKMRVVRIVSASSVSKADLEQRLVQKGESKCDAHQAVAWMEDLNLLNIVSPSIDFVLMIMLVMVEVVEVIVVDSLD